MLFEGALAGAPAGDEEHAGMAEGEFGAAEGIEEADEDELAGTFLADVVAEERGLQVG